MLYRKLHGQLRSGISLKYNDPLDLVLAQVDVHEKQRPRALQILLIILSVEENLLAILV